MINPLHKVSCRTLKGVGEKVAAGLLKLNIESVQDLLFHLPYRYQDRTRVIPIRQLTPGDYVVVEGFVERISAPPHGRTKFLCQLRDASGCMSLRFFYINPAQRRALKVGLHLRCFGEVRRGLQGCEFIHPEYQVIDDELVIEVDNTLTPIYPTTEGVSQLLLRKLSAQALQLLDAGGEVHDLLPRNVLQTFTMPSLKDALTYVHRPPSDAPVDLLLTRKHLSQKRLGFEELLAHRLSLLKIKATMQQHKALPLSPATTLIDTFLTKLPFKLTMAQERVYDEIAADIAKDIPMLRLIQGDVGSGKTVVAALCALHAIDQKTQVAILAPTELLAEQHYQTFKLWLEPLDISVILLTGQLTVTQKAKLYAQMESGHAQVIIGTHAIFQKKAEFKNLSFIIVDEQHRFGVEQRAQLRKKGMSRGLFPHQLIMTATPIPRTLAMSAYADLDYSVIDELPPGRVPVTTTVLINTRRPDILQRIRHACQSGAQAYWVCTLVEESEVLQCQAAEKTALDMKEIFPELRIGLIHGRMNARDKESVMADFKAAKLNLLVATTVIEVGVDVPNASLMIIENAERLGLAQLHQLRGRVGRGAKASHCVLLYQHPLSQLAKERLKIMRETTDGFKIAQRDLELRGPGEVLGTRQTGDFNLRIADLLCDADLLPQVEAAADVIIKNHPENIAPLIQRWLGSATNYASV